MPAKPISRSRTHWQWLEDCTHDGGSLAFALSSDLFASWKIWCEASNQSPGTMQALSEALSARGYAKRGSTGAGQGLQG